MKKIVIIPNETKDLGLNVTKTLIDILHNKAEIFMEEKFNNSGLSAEFLSKNLYDNADTVIVVGGDGTMLCVAEPCGKRSIPVMGINMGRVGFMTEIETYAMEQACQRLLENDYRLEKRMMMDIKIKKGEKEISGLCALNDVVLSKVSAKMISAELYADKNKINAYVADGLIISTPTGSTGYSLSAGGPVADPSMELFIASPMCAHMLNSRPAVMPADKDIILKLKEGSATVTIDGVICEQISAGDEVIASKSEHTFNIIKMSDRSFYDILINKLS